MTAGGVPGPPLDRSLFPVTERWTYVNCAAMAPNPRPVVEAVHAAMADAAAGGILSFAGQMSRLDEIRATAARLLGVAAEDLSFVANTTDGLGVVANGLDLGPGDRVVVPDGEFASAVFPWLALRDRGVEVDLVPPSGPAGALPVDAFAEVIAAGQPPAVVTTSWVQAARGYRCDLEALARLAHDVGAVLVVDAIQGLGVVPSAFAEWGVDAATADGHKWLLGPNGAGLLYVAPALRERLRVARPGWLSVPDEAMTGLRLDWHPDGRRFEGGSPNLAGIHGLGAALDLLATAGAGPVWEHVRSLGDALAADLAARGAAVLSDRSRAAASGIVAVEVPGRRAEDVVAELHRAGIVASARGGAVRLSPHAFNTAAEMADVAASVASPSR